RPPGADRRLRSAQAAPAPGVADLQPLRPGQPTHRGWRRGDLPHRGAQPLGHAVGADPAQPLRAALLRPHARLAARHARPFRLRRPRHAAGPGGHRRHHRRHAGRRRGPHPAQRQGDARGGADLPRPAAPGGRQDPGCRAQPLQLAAVGPRQTLQVLRVLRRRGERAEGRFSRLMIDLHCHILPGVDDGAQSLEEAAAMCRLAARDGCEAMVATPHQRRGEWWNSDREGLSTLAGDLQDAVGPGFRVYLGGEVHVDSALLAEVEKLPAGGVLPLAGSHYLLLELDSQGTATEAIHLVPELAVAGWYPILAHPEFIPWLATDPEL